MPKEVQGLDHRLTFDKLNAVRADAQSLFETNIAEALSLLHNAKITNNSTRSLQDLIHIVEDRARLLRMLRATSKRAVGKVRPGSAIIVSRPQSLNQ